MNGGSRAPCAFVVMERGGRLPPQSLARPLTTTRTLVSQRPAESPDELVERTAARLCELEDGGRGIGFALLACGESADDDAVLSRAKLADVILAHLRRARDAHLVLAARHRAGSKLRRELLSLADHAITTLGARGDNVSIWFGDASHV